MNDGEWNTVKFSKLYDEELGFCPPSIVKFIIFMKKPGDGDCPVEY